MRTRSLLPLLLLALSLSACPSSAVRPDDEVVAPSADKLVGTWEDDEGAEFTFAERDGRVTVTEILDTDGELFELRRFGFEDGQWLIVYYVPSTKVTITVHLDDAVGDELTGEWKNSKGESGPEIFTRTDGYVPDDESDDETDYDGGEGDGEDDAP